MTYTMTLDEEERQCLLLALAHLRVERPGWSHFLRSIVDKLDGGLFYTECLYMAQLRHRKQDSDQAAAASPSLQPWGHNP